jgi:hypothetical protein
MAQNLLILCAEPAGSGKCGDSSSRCFANVIRFLDVNRVATVPRTLRRAHPLAPIAPSHRCRAAPPARLLRQHQAGCVEAISVRASSGYSGGSGAGVFPIVVKSTDQAHCHHSQPAFGGEHRHTGTAVHRWMKPIGLLQVDQGRQIAILT